MTFLMAPAVKLTHQFTVLWSSSGVTQTVLQFFSFTVFQLFSVCIFLVLCKILYCNIRHCIVACKAVGSPKQPQAWTCSPWSTLLRLKSKTSLASQNWAPERGYQNKQKNPVLIESPKFWKFKVMLSKSGCGRSQNGAKAGLWWWWATCSPS